MPASSRPLMPRLLRHAWIALLIAVGLTSAHAQPSAWPDRPVKLLVGFAAGGSADLVARVMASALTERLGKPVVVENRPGAGSVLAAQAAAGAPADGYTLLFGSIALSVQMATDPQMKLDPLTELTPVALFAEAPNVLVINPALPVQSVSELIAWAKAGHRLNFASSGVGTTLHLAGEMLKSRTGADMVHVAYKGSGPALTDLMGGQVQMMFDSLATSMPHIKSGKLRALAVTTRTRSSLLPEVPTMVEAGYDNFEVSVWFGSFAPKDTPAAIVQRLARETALALDQSEVQNKLIGLSTTVLRSESPAAFATFFRDDAARWKLAVAAAGLKVER